MLRSLEIRNYRNLRHLSIEKLGRVNLLVGKNNTGKTSVLEAISILMHQANLQWITQIFEDRVGRDASPRFMEPEQLIEYNTELLSDMFYGREIRTDKQSSVLIAAEDLWVNLRFVYYIRETIEDELKQTTYSKISVVDTPNEAESMGVEVTNGDQFRVVTLNKRLNSPPRFGGLKENIQFVRTNGGIRQDSNGRLWDKITSTDKNAYVEDALRIVEPNLTNLRFVLPNVDSYSNQKRDERIGVVQLDSLNKPIPLHSMGDGINRILTIILAMVNCENGYLLIDEFENGLHYSVQEKLWEIIFYLAERLNIQVFATTHSNDTIKAFGDISNSKPGYKDAQLIQLRQIKGDISAVLFDAHDVEIATETDYLDLR